MHALTPCVRTPRFAARLSVTRLLLFLLMLLVAKSGIAGTFAAFGPVTYVRDTGDPVTVTNAFSVRNPATQYTLHIVNGGLTDTPYELVSSSLIALNGVQVVGPDSFNQNVTVLDVPVTLQESNSISVQVRGKPGGALSIEVIGVDNDPPVVSASAAPAANANGWNNSDVTVSFTCSDATSGIATCPAAQTVSTEGEGQLITGTATDNAANTASASLTVNLDKTPPSLTVTMPGGTVSNSPLTVSGSASDALSGLDSVTCNELSGTLSGTNFTCEVSLVQGANSIVITVTDRAGNSGMQTLAVTLGQELSPPPNSVQITPNAMALVVGEPREIALVDDFGRTLSGATWTTSDPSVAQISTDTGVVLTGLAAGPATITAAFQNFTAQAQVTVFAGPTLPPGTVRWSVQPAPAFSTVQVLQAQPAENAPDIYSVEEEGTGNLIIRALSSDGREIWQKPVVLSGAMELSTATAQYTGRWFIQALGDVFGGLLILTADDFFANSEITRLDGATGQETWRFTSPGFLFRDWALHPDGTIFVGEIPNPAFFLNREQDFFNLANRDIQVLAINGTTGTVKSRVAVPGSFGAFESDCPSFDNSFFPSLAGLGAPMVAPNGSMFVEVATRSSTDQFFPPCTFGTVQTIRDTTLLLLELRPDGSSAWRTLKQDHFEGPRDTAPPFPEYGVGEVIPDGQGGLLAAWTCSCAPFGTLTLEVRMDHVTDSGQNEYTLFPHPSSIPREGSLVLGEGGTAFARNSEGKIVSFDTASGTVHWTWELDSTFSHMVAAAAGNGLVVAVLFQDGTHRIARLDSTGLASFDDWTWPGGIIQYAFGDMWLAQGSVEAISAPAILWPFSLWPLPNQGEPHLGGPRNSKGTITLQVHRVLDSSNGGQPTATDITVNDQVNQAIAYWQQQAGILLKWDGHFDDVPSCDPAKFPNGCLGGDLADDLVSIPTIPAPGQKVTETVLEVLRRFCGQLNNLDPRCTPSGSQLLFTNLVDNKKENGGTPPIGGVQINVSFLGKGAAGLTTAHELGHQFQLPHCSLFAPPTVPPLFCGPDNLMTGDRLTATPGANLFPIQITIARAGARKWSQ